MRQHYIQYYIIIYNIIIIINIIFLLVCFTFLRVSEAVAIQSGCVQQVENHVILLITSSNVLELISESHYCRHVLLQLKTVNSISVFQSCLTGI